MHKHKKLMALRKQWQHELEVLGQMAQRQTLGNLRAETENKEVGQMGEESKLEKKMMLCSLMSPSNPQQKYNQYLERQEKAATQESQ